MRYCQKTNEKLLEVINKKKPKTMDRLADIWYTTQGANYGRTQHYNGSRYHGLNLHATFTKGTVEFRLFNRNPKEIGSPKATFAKQKF